MTNPQKKPTGRHACYTVEFRAEAVRFVQTSGRSLSEIALDLGIAVSTLGKWVAALRKLSCWLAPT